MGNQKFLSAVFIAIFIPGLLCAQQNPGQNAISSETDTNRIYRNLKAALTTPDKVYRLHLNHQRLDSLPLEIFQLTNLRELNLSRNKLENLPPEIGQLQYLEHLDLSNNKLSRLPDEIGQLNRLIYLGLNRNVITALPSTIGNMEKLEVLELWDNELEDVPDEISELKNLRVLELRGILFSEEQQARIDGLVVRSARIYMSPSCNCKD